MQNGLAVFGRRSNPSSHRSSREVRIALGFLVAASAGIGCMPAPTESGGSGGASTGGATPASGGATTPGSGGAAQGSGGAPQGSGGAVQGSGGAGTGGAASGGISGGSGGRSGTGGMSTGSGGRANTGGAAGGAGGPNNTGGASGATGGAPGNLAKFSFFVASVDAMKKLSANAQGFGGDLRFGETGDGAGLKGADKICSTIADTSMAGSSAKGWRAFLSAPAMGSMPVVNAIERIGNGPWYDRMGRLFSANKANLIGFRPSDADPAIKNDFPNEYGIPNHNPDGTGQVDNHDTLTGSNDQGKLYAGANNPTCDGWTNKTGSAGKPRVGHSWPRMPSANNTCTGGGGGIPGGGGGMVANAGCYGHWMSSLDEAGCAPGISLVEMGPPNPNDPTVGSGGGYGGIFCFALMP